MDDDFYGNPECGLIDENNQWAVVAGGHLTLWKLDFEKRYFSEEFKWIHAMRMKDENTVEILTDPWMKFSAVWQLNLYSIELVKIKPFQKYYRKPYFENVEW